MTRCVRHVGSIEYTKFQIFLQWLRPAITSFHWLTKFRICHRRHRCYRNTTKSIRSNSATVTIDRPIAVQIVCAHIKSIFHWMRSLKLCWSMKVSVHYSVPFDNQTKFSLSFVATVQQPNLSHPFHLHGYGMNVIGIGRSPDTTVKKINLKHALDLDRRGLLHRQYNLPPLKDTIAVPNNGYVVLRFRADNPGD